MGDKMKRKRRGQVEGGGGKKKCNNIVKNREMFVRKGNERRATRVQVYCTNEKGILNR